MVDWCVFRRIIDVFSCLCRSVAINNNSNNADLLGLSTPPANVNSNQASLIDVLGDIYTNGSAPVHNAKK